MKSEVEGMLRDVALCGGKIRNIDFIRFGEVKSPHVRWLMNSCFGGSKMRRIRVGCEEAVSVDKVSRGAAFFAPGAAMQLEVDVREQGNTAHYEDSPGRGAFSCLST